MVEDAGEIAFFNSNSIIGNIDHEVFVCRLRNGDSNLFWFIVVMVFASVHSVTNKVNQDLKHAVFVDFYF